MAIAYKFSVALQPIYLGGHDFARGRSKVLSVGATTITCARITARIASLTFVGDIGDYGKDKNQNRCQSGSECPLSVTSGSASDDTVTD